MKQVFSDITECIHVFAQQTQSEGRSGTVSFQTNEIFSYSQCIGNIRGKNIFLIDWNYSITTAKHNSWLYSATSQYNQIFCYYPYNPESEDNITHFESDFDKIITSLASAKKPEIHISRIGVLQNNINNFLVALPKLDKDLKKRLKKLTKWNLDNSDLIDKAKERIYKQRKEAQEKLNNEILNFHNFETDRVNQSYYSFLRLNNGNIETSQGVKIETLKVLPFIAIYKNWLVSKSQDLLNKLLGKHLDYYVINAINENFVTIGCHKIPKDEILNLQID